MHRALVLHLTLSFLVVAVAAPVVANAAVDWLVDLDPESPGESLSTALLGHYDLSGDLLAYDQKPGLVANMVAVDFSDWRVGVGRWEALTRLLPTLTDSTPCSIVIPGSAAPAGFDDLALIAARDWFVDDGQPVTLADTQDDSRYALGYLRSVLDIVDAFGATPFVSIDSMPRALAVNRTPSRTDCNWTFQNQVTNVRPANAAIFASAVVGMVERIIEGSGSAPARPVTHWEVWNEPEFLQFWDPAFEDLAGPLDRYFEMAINILVALDSYRASSPHPNAVGLRFGLGSFGTAAVAAITLAGFDTAALPMGFVPLDFVSFHGYSDDPLEVVATIDAVAAAAAATSHYSNIELALAEWGPNLSTSVSDPVYAASMEPALHLTTVLALGAAVGLDRAHRAIFWDFFPNSIRLGLLDHNMNPRPAYRAYELLSQLIIAGAVRIEALGLEDGRLDGGNGAVLASRDSVGTKRVLLVNRNTAARTAEVHFNGSAVLPTRISRYDDPTLPIADIPVVGSEINLPAKSIVLVEFGPAAIPAFGYWGPLFLFASLVCASFVVRQHGRVRS